MPIPEPPCLLHAHIFVCQLLRAKKRSGTEPPVKLGRVVGAIRFLYRSKKQDLTSGCLLSTRQSQQAGRELGFPTCRNLPSQKLQNNSALHFSMRRTVRVCQQARADAACLVSPPEAKGLLSGLNVHKLTKCMKSSLRGTRSRQTGYCFFPSFNPGM